MAHVSFCFRPVSSNLNLNRLYKYLINKTSIKIFVRQFFFSIDIGFWNRKIIIEKIKRNIIIIIIIILVSLEINEATLFPNTHIRKKKFD